MDKNRSGAAIELPLPSDHCCHRSVKRVARWESLPTSAMPTCRASAVASWHAPRARQAFRSIAYSSIIYVMRHMFVADGGDHLLKAEISGLLNRRAQERALAS